MDPSPLKLMFYYVYLLYSEKYGKFYIGYTENMQIRIGQHNNEESYWTKRYIPWRVIYFEEYRSKVDALNREKQLKRFAKGMAQLKLRLSDTLKLQR